MKIIDKKIIFLKAQGHISKGRENELLCCLEMSNWNKNDLKVPKKENETMVAKE